MKDRILIIEPEQNEQSRMQRYLVPEYDITFVSEIQDAIDSISEKLHKVIIYDLDFPESKVITDLLRLKDSIEDIPMITITSLNSLEMEKTVRGVGIFYYLLKPYKVTDLSNVINAAIHLWERRHHYKKVD